MKYSLGIDIGSVTAKLALIDENNALAELYVETVMSGPKAALANLLSRLGAKVDLASIATAGVSGCGSSAIPGGAGWNEYSSSLAIAAGVLNIHPDARTIISIGGQSSLVVSLQQGLDKPWKVVSNPLCAAGTGRFMEQQAYRLGIDLNEFSRLALSYEGSAPRIAARCSVFAKSDLIHLQQKGVSLPAMLRGLCDSISRMVVSLKRGKFDEPVFFVGGVAANGAILRSLAEEITSRNGKEVAPIVPENYVHIEAIGAALLARSSNRKATVFVSQGEDNKQHHFVTPALAFTGQLDGWTPPQIEHPFVGYLGVDVGSTSTKAVILDESGKTVVAKNYLMTAGRPVDAVKQVFRNLYASLGEKVKIAGAGVTGSGRYLVGSIIGADLVRNEITAQTRAAFEVEPKADIIEIGGQDSKLVIKRNGVVVDYQMNKACAAGTGSFIDELADMLGVSVKNGDFAKLAFEAPQTIDLGTRCAAFMGQAVSSAQQEGISTQVTVASLANSIAGNYLSKVVGNRKLGQKVILTGAVFYNDAVVSAFKQALKDKDIIVPIHKEVSGAIGAALLARETMRGRESSFKGLKMVADAQHTLSTFICKACDNNCTITRLNVDGEKATFYGSRCDRYDGTLAQGHVETPFDERERLLLAGHSTLDGEALTVGIPRTLLVYDYIPMLTAFLEALGVKAVVSTKTNQEVMEQAIELAYSDSCFPVKLAHGHVAVLRDVDYILFPSFIRMGEKEGDESQKYSCPLVQAAPFIIQQTLDLDRRMLIPIIDLSRGTSETIANLTAVAEKLGFSAQAGRQAAKSGLERQRQFEKAQSEAGSRLLEQLKDKGQLGVVIFSRPYMSQDSGANLGIAEKLAQLGVVPIPMDFLPLSTVDVKRYSDRPYWASECKHIAAAAITAGNPLLYGLVLTNFGCGPNSFMLNLVEDIMGGKPLGQLEIDEHAAEAGIVTRVEAFVDTIKDFHRSKQDKTAMVPLEKIYRSSPTVVPNGKVLIVPRMSPHVDAVVASMNAYGARAIVLPEPDERNLLHANKVTSGKECLPYRVTLGDFMRFYYDNGHQGLGLAHVEGYMAGSFGPCRLGKYALEQRKLLQDIGFDLPIRTTVSNNAYSDMGLGKAFERLAWKGVVAVDYLLKMTWHVRPYEKEAGATDKLFDKHLKAVTDALLVKKLPDSLMKEAAMEFVSLRDPDLPKRPLVGINGEIFLRSSNFSNCNLVRACEEAGLEVMASSWAEWVNYIYDRTLSDAVKDRKLKKIVTGYIRNKIQKGTEESVARIYREHLDIEEPTTRELLGVSGEYLSSRCGSEAVLSIGSGVEWMENPKMAGVISVMPHGCMPGGIVAAMSEKFSALHGKPWINLTYDGTAETNNQVRINNFAEIIRYYHKNGSSEGK